MKYWLTSHHKKLTADHKHRQIVTQIVLVHSV